MTHIPFQAVQAVVSVSASVSRTGSSAILWRFDRTYGSRTNLLTDFRSFPIPTQLALALALTLTLTLTTPSGDNFLERLGIPS
jgi:hypothetical protein